MPTLSCSRTWDYLMSTTFSRLLATHAAQRPSASAMREKEYGIWQSMDWVAMLQMVTQMACGLHQAGLQRGEHLVVIGANRPRLYATMLAAQALGAIPVPLYQDAVAGECVQDANPVSLPSFEAIDILRQAKNKLTPDSGDYASLKKGIFENGRQAQEAKKDLTAFIRKRQELLPEQAQSKRKFATLNRLLGSLKALKRETEALKLLSAPLVRELDSLISKIDAEIVE